ncbi:MAG TPA: hypothetical protein VM656_07635, partial [Pyrinomonadaceae bacterium]|nr:hypothetical protein [Pyrinomonadaceae bacterium]
HNERTNMRGAYTQYVKSKGVRPEDVVEQAKARHKEQCELRLARIMNGKEPGYKNGHGGKKG